MNFNFSGDFSSVKQVKFIVLWEELYEFTGFTSPMCRTRID
jgi:hypothetical protein